MQYPLARKPLERGRTASRARRLRYQITTPVTDSAAATRPMTDTRMRPGRPGIEGGAAPPPYAQKWYANRRLPLRTWKESLAEKPYSAFISKPLRWYTVRPAVKMPMMAGEFRVVWKVPS